MISLNAKKEACKKILTAEGFLHVFEWKEEPNFKYDEHSHKDRVSFFVVKGSIKFSYTGVKDIEIIAGDRVDVNPHEDHTAKVGSHGCRFVVGEMIKGDS